MPKDVLINMKAMDKDVAGKAGKLEMLAAPKGMTFMVEVEFDAKIAKSVEKDPLLHQQMVNAARDVYDDLVARIGQTLQVNEKAAVKLRDTGELTKIEPIVSLVNNKIKAERAVAVTQAQSKVVQVWEKLQATKKEYKQYKIKAGVSLSASFAGLGAGITLMATSGFTGGASAAFGIIGLFKSVTAIAEQITSLALEAEKAIALLDKEIQLLKIIQGNTKKSLVANEYSAAFVKTFLGVSQPTVKKCNEHLDTVYKKIGGIDIKSHDSAKALNKILADIKKLETEFMAEVNRKLAKHPSPLAKGQAQGIQSKLNAYLEPHELKAHEKIGKIHVLVKRVEDTKKDADKTAAEVQKLSAHIASAGKGPAYLEMALRVVDIGTALIGDGNSLVKNVAEYSANLAPAVGDFVIDRISSKVFEGSFLEV